MTIRMKQDKETINKTIDVAKSSGAMAAITGYSIGDIQAVVDEVRKKAMENAQQNDQDSASAYGFTLGKIIGITESPGPNIEISRPRSLYSPFRPRNPFAFRLWWRMDHIIGGENIRPGMTYVRSSAWVTYEVSQT
jgi:hypothetical protein